MSTVKEHYDNHLGNFYSWMIGDFKTLVSKQKEDFLKAGITGGKSPVAFDLGAGNGVQSVALSALGYRVFSIDFNKQLIDELKINAVNSDVTIIEDDLFVCNRIDSPADLTVCCGDTIAHLPCYEKVEELIAGCYSRLQKGGKLYLSFRDYSNELNDTDRFIPVKQDDNRIFTCFLEYFEKTVRVTDILLENDGGKWVQKISSYLKLRISVPMIQNIMERNGYKISYKENGRMNALVGEK